MAEKSKSQATPYTRKTVDLQLHDTHRTAVDIKLPKVID